MKITGQKFKTLDFPFMWSNKSHMLFLCSLTVHLALNEMANIGVLLYEFYVAVIFIFWNFDKGEINCMLITI